MLIEYYSGKIKRLHKRQDRQYAMTNLLSGSARHGVYLPLGLREPVERQIALVLLELDRD